MKSLNVVFVILLVYIIAQGAMAETSKEICFLEKSWDVDIITYAKAIKQTLQPLENERQFYVDSRLFGYFFDETQLEMYKVFSFKDGVGLFYSTVLPESLNMTMYGYPVEWIHIEAVSPSAQEYEPTESITTNCICMLDRKKIADISCAHYDVFNQLCAQYGKPDTTKTQEGYSIEYVWYGKKETYVNLSIGLNSKGEEGSVSIKHGTTRSKPDDK